MHGFFITAQQLYFIQNKRAFHAVHFNEFARIYGQLDNDKMRTYNNSYNEKQATYNIVCFVSQ